MAKLACELAKPDGLLVVEPGTELAFLHPLDVSRLWGVGPATRRRLDRLGVRTIGDLAALPEAALQSALGRAHGSHLAALARNDDDRPVEPSRQPKSIGHEETFATDLTDRDTLERDVLRFAERIGARLREAGLVARTVQLKARYGDFRTLTRSRTMPEPTNLAEDLAGVGRELLADVDVTPGLRLLGLAAQQLVAVDGAQAALPLDAPAGVDRERRSDLERVVDDVRRRFGEEAVTRVSRRRSRSA